MSGARPGARRKSIAEYVKRIGKLEAVADSVPGVDHSYAIQAGREVRVIAKPNKIDERRQDRQGVDGTALAMTEEDGHAHLCGPDVAGIGTDGPPGKGAFNGRAMSPASPGSP
jgi:ribonuclease Y